MWLWEKFYLSIYLFIYLFIYFINFVNLTIIEK